MTYNPYAHPDGLFPGTGAGFTPQPQPMFSKAEGYGFPVPSKPGSPLPMTHSLNNPSIPQYSFPGQPGPIQGPPTAGQLRGQRTVGGPGSEQQQQQQQQVGGVPALGYQTQPWPQPLHHGQMNPSYVPQQRSSAGNENGMRTMQVWAYTVFVAAPVGTPLSFSRSLAPLSSDASPCAVTGNGQSVAMGLGPGTSCSASIPATVASVPDTVRTEPPTIPAAVPAISTISSLPPQFPSVVPVATLPFPNTQISTGFPAPPVQIANTTFPERPVEINDAGMLPASTAQQGGPVDFSFGFKGDYASTYTVTKINQDVQTIRGAMKGSSKEGKHIIIDTIGHLVPEELQMLALSYKCTYGISLSELFHKNVPGRFGKLLHAVSTPPVVYDCECIHEALTRIGVPDEDVLMEILVGRRNAEIHAICETYYRRYGKDLEKHISHDVSGHVKRLLIALIQGRRDESGQMLDVESDVETLREAGEGGKGVDDFQFMSVLATRSDRHLRGVFVEYEGKYGHDIATVVKKAFSGEMERCLLSLVRSAKDRALWAAELFESSMSGLGVRDNMLIRLATRFRHPFVITPIKEAYIRKFGMTLERRIEDATAREYQTLLLLLIRGKEKDKAGP